MDINIKSNAWFSDYRDCAARFKAIKGGRSSGKTTEVAQDFVRRSLTERTKILCSREYQKNIKNSSYGEIEEATIRMFGAKRFQYFDFVPSSLFIRSVTGSEIHFIGLQNPSVIMSMQGLEYFWVDQAEKVSEESFKIAIPSVRGSNKAEIWATWNPENPTDAVEKLAKHYEGNSIVKHVNYTDNAFCPQVMIDEAEMCKAYAAAEYPWIWLGEYRTTNLGGKVLQIADLKRAIGAAEKLKYKHRVSYGYLGVDACDGGADAAAICHRRSSEVIFANETPDKNGYQLATRAINYGHLQHIARCYYDAIGVGAALKSEFYRVEKDTKDKLPFITCPFVAGATVGAPKSMFLRPFSNADFFSNLSAQGWWNLKLRLQNTQRALEGDHVNLDYCLFLPKNTSEQMLYELAQIEYDISAERKIRINKQPAGTKSPNIADAVMMSFAFDLQFGLRAF